MKVAIYARVSTDEQTEQNQINTLEKWASDRGWDVAGVYRDVGSAFQHADQRHIKELLADCRRGKYQQVLVYDLSRLTRQGPLELMIMLKQFVEAGSPVFSWLEQVINVPNDFQPVLVSLYGVMNKIFSTSLSERTKAGMARAKAEGKHVGRPRKVRITLNPEDKKAHSKLDSLNKRMQLLQKQMQELSAGKGLENGEKQTTPFRDKTLSK